MGKYSIELLAPAWEELEGIADYYKNKVGPQAASRVVNRILDALDRLEEFPLSTNEIPVAELCRQGYRMVICGDYLCFCRLFENTVYIYHIANGKSDYSKLFQ